MELDVKTECEDGVCVVTVTGEVDVYTSPGLKTRLLDAIDSGCSRMIVALDGVTFIDSSGLGVLVGALRRLKERGDELRIVCSRDQVIKIFRITGLDKVFHIVATLDEAREI